MKKLFVVLFALALLPAQASAQDSTSTARRINPRASAPATCSADRGEVYFNTTDDKLYRCTAANTWTEVGNSGTVTGTGTTNRVTKFSNGAGGVLSNSLLSDDGTDVTLTSGTLYVPGGATSGALSGGLQFTGASAGLGVSSTNIRFMLGGTNRFNLSTLKDFRIPSDHFFAWASATSNEASADTGLARPSAAKVKVTDGSTGYGSLDASGIQFSGGTTLTTYTEGNCTLSLKFGGNSTGMTYSTQTCKYTHDGNQVTVIANLILSAKGSSTGTATITGLPVAATATAGRVQAGIAVVAAATYTGVSSTYVDPGTTTTLNLIVNNGGTASFLNDTHFGNTSSIQVHITYFTN